MSKLFVWAALILFLFAFVHSVFAEEGIGMRATLQNHMCKINLTKSSINSIIKNVNEYENNFSNLTDKLNNISLRLNKAANTKNAKEFNRIGREELGPTILSVNREIMLWREEYTKLMMAKSRRESTENDSIKILHDQFDNMREQYSVYKKRYDECAFASLKALALQRLNAYKEDLDVVEDNTEELAIDGAPTEEIQKVIDNARIEIIYPYEQAIKGSSVTSEISQAVNKFCLYEGCPKGINFHLGAKYELEKLSVVLPAVKEKVNDSALQEKINFAIASLEEAKAVLRAVGSAQYAGVQHQGVWKPIKDSYEILNESKRNIFEGQNG